MKRFLAWKYCISYDPQDWSNLHSVRKGKAYQLQLFKELDKTCKSKVVFVNHDAEMFSCQNVGKMTKIKGKSSYHSPHNKAHSPTTFHAAKHQQSSVFVIRTADTDVLITAVACFVCLQH